MTCSKCKSTPSMDYYDVDVYISTQTEPIELTLIKVLKSIKYDFQTVENYLIVYTPNFELFISELSEGEFFESIELSDIQVLPVARGVQPGFSQYQNTHSLYYWISLMQEKEVVQILKSQSLKTVFQPIFHAGDLSLYGHEGLTRGIREDGRLMSPSELFAGAKKLDLLFNLDRQCREATINHASGEILNHKLFINFIPTAIYDPNECLSSTVAAVAQRGIQPENIVFEVVETERVEDYSHLKKILRYYKNQGFKTALDDVGSGFSTLEAYHALDTDFIKLDISLIQNIHKTPIHQTLLERLMPLKEQYGVKLLAEGVENEQEYAYLKTIGIDYVQGYYFGRPK